MNRIDRQRKLISLIREDDQILGFRMHRRVVRMFDHVFVATRKRNLHGEMFC